MMESAWAAVLPDSADVTDGELAVGGQPIRLLAERYGTPLYVYDEETLRNNARSALSAFRPLEARVSFASKACATLGVLRLLRGEGLQLDVVSLGELEAGLRAGFRPDQIHLHGNCKSDQELERAVSLGLHAIVLDNLEEVARLEAIARALGRPARVMLRLTLALEGETHPHLQTSGGRSKFGFLRHSSYERQAIDLLACSPHLQLRGVHAHLGSQLADLRLYVRAGEELFRAAESLQAEGFAVAEVSLGGGWAVAYRLGDRDLAPARLAEHLAPLARAHPGLRLAVEPGRFLVARAAVAVYRVGSVKRTDVGRIVAVDGGMGDNPRPALYGASYSAVPAHGPCDPTLGPADIVGRYCESGDVLARDVPLARVGAGDLICLPVAGAYQLSMASAYNLVPGVAAVLVGSSRSRLLTRRGTVDDLLRRDVLEEE